MVVGINLGSGSGWSCPNWTGLDELSGNRLTETSIFPHEDGSIRYVYSAHFFEHVSDSVSRNLFSESNRVLRKGGVIRILVPNFALLIEKYKKDDTNFFKNVIGFWGRPEWASYGVETNITSVLLHWVSNYDDRSNGFYRGGPIIEESLVRKNSEKMSVGEFCTWVHSHIPNNSQIKTQHINWWTLDKFQRMLNDAGFCDVQTKAHLESDIPDVYKTNKFDSYADRSSSSLVIEAKT